MSELLAVGLGGFLGAVVRYRVSQWAQRFGDSFPIATLVVNLAGCLAIGVVMALAERQALDPRLRLFLGVGVLGALTTFSTFGFETVELMRRGAFGPAALNVAGSLLLGFGAVWLGLTAGRLWNP
ncbi:MAG: fluoride efflux transporter CrcB [Acidobacteriota bacterium]